MWFSFDPFSIEAFKSSASCAKSTLNVSDWFIFYSFSYYIDNIFFSRFSRSFWTLFKSAFILSPAFLRTSVFLAALEGSSLILLHWSPSSSCFSYRISISLSNYFPCFMSFSKFSDSISMRSLISAISCSAFCEIS